MTFSALRTSSTLLSLLLLLIVAGPVRAQSGGVVDEIVAVVGNDIVLRSEVDGIVYNIVQQGQAQYSDGLWIEMLDQMVDQPRAAFGQAPRFGAAPEPFDGVVRLRRLQPLLAELRGDDDLLEFVQLLRSHGNARGAGTQHEAQRCTDG